MSYSKIILCMILFVLIEIASSQVLNFGSGLEEGDAIIWTGRTSNQTNPAKLSFFRRSKRVATLEIQGHRSNFVIYGKSRRRQQCFQDRNTIGPETDFHVLVRLSDQKRVKVFLNKKLRLHFLLESSSFTADSDTFEVTQARVYGPKYQITRSFRFSPVAELGSSLNQESSCGRVISRKSVPEGCSRKNSTCRIVGGIPADPGAHPWQAAIRHADEFIPSGSDRPKHICGAVLVGRTWAITAAHCFASVYPATIKRYRIRVGDYNNFDGAGNPKYENSQDHEIKRVIQHPGYDQSMNPENDIALIELATPVQYNVFVQPACFPTSTGQFAEGETCGIAGWGAQFFGQEPTSYPTCLQTAGVRIYPNFLCTSWYSNITFNTKQIMCAGNPCVDSCQGDSGGPLMCSQNGRYYAWGVTSWGVKCGGRTKPGVYTRVARYLPWLQEVMHGFEVLPLEVHRGRCPRSTPNS